MEDEKRSDRRVGAELRLRLAYESVDEFIERYATNVSRGGIFVRTRDPSPPGTELRIDIALERGDEVIRGRGIVRWTTPPSAPGEPAHEPGMGVKFTELTPESRALVDLVVATLGGGARSEEPPIPEDVDL
ncbi:MAG TPA: TIGR02266 family protein, partial [Anaeromyxobacter sp.]|nr:TIGR02266 family protein [Anaeromyxobacter sp.]